MVCFSNESSVQILSDKAEFARRRKGEKFKEDCIVNRVKYPLSVMVWSIISSKGTGRLNIVEGTMRQDLYIQVLETKMLPQVLVLFPNGEFKLMHDSAPCHKAKKVTKFLNAQKVKVLDWPGNPLDLNPIENFWELMKREISREVVNNKRELIERLIDVWHRSESVKINCSKCIESMPRKIQAVIEAKGGVTKY
ncbi:unnamed protein product [Parnassius mnemosyne]|uniref:Tc1-like transposase DDE domain-containing protein n=1 Tax=Parnassius mnemosyne TaxID=213953 RepID=A0AAV1LL26_9NEOP